MKKSCQSTSKFDKTSFNDDSPKKCSGKGRRNAPSDELDFTKERLQFLQTLQTLKNITLARRRASKTLDNLASENLVSDFVRPDASFFTSDNDEPLSDKPYPTEEEAIAAATDKNGVLDKGKIVNHCLAILSTVISDLVVLLPKVYKIRREVSLRKIKELDELIEALGINP